MKSLLLAALLTLSLNGCAFNRPDHFYALTAQPVFRQDLRASFSRQIVLRVSLPSLVDRSELVLRSPDGIVILEHERWAAPLTDQVTNILGQDLEQRRSDVLITSQRISQPGTPTLVIAVDVVSLVAIKGQSVSLEARWRVEDASAGGVTLGRASFSAPQPNADYAGIAQALSACIAQLADQLLPALGPN